MEDIIIGLSLTAITILLYKWIYGWYIYKRSVYKVIYSSYLEFYFKKSKIKKLSESSVFADDFGKHRILFQLFSTKAQKMPQPYIIIILSSGMYLLKVSNAQGEVYGEKTGPWINVVSLDKKHQDKRVNQKLTNPNFELQQFNQKVQEKISKINTQVYKIVVFPDQSTLKLKSEKIGEITAIYRSKLCKTLMDIHKSKDKELDEWEIDALWQMVAKDSLMLD